MILKFKVDKCFRRTLVKDKFHEMWRVVHAMETMTQY